MEVINNATEAVSALTQIRGRKEELLQILDKENARTQDIIRKQNSKRQEVMVYCVLGAFCALCSYLIRIAKDSLFHSSYLPFTLIMVVLALFFLYRAIRSYPASVKYQGTWKNYKEAKTYEEVLTESNSKKKETSAKISALNAQLDRLDKSVAKKVIPDN